MSGSPLNQVGDVATKVSAVLLNVIMVLFLVGIVARRLPSVSDPGATELATILGVWIVYLVFVTETLSLRHLKVEYFVDKLSEDRQRPVILFGIVLGALTTFFLFVSSIYLTMSYTRGTTPALDLPRYVISIPIAFGFGVGSLAFVKKAIDLLRGEA